MLSKLDKHNMVSVLFFKVSGEMFNCYKSAGTHFFFSVFFLPQNQTFLLIMNGMATDLFFVIKGQTDIRFRIYISVNIKNSCGGLDFINADRLIKLLIGNLSHHYLCESHNTKASRCHFLFI